MATTDTDVQNLIVNKLTYAQWKAAKAAGTLSETETYEFTDTDTALQEKLTSGVNIKTINNSSILGSGNISVNSLPTQTGQSGKFLTTDGTDVSWANVAGALPSQSGQSGKYLTTDGSTASWGDTMETVETSLKTVNGNLLIGTGDITITSAPDLDETTINLNNDDELQAIGVINQNNTTSAIKTWTGTKAQYDAITTKDNNTLYNITDDTQAVTYEAYSKSETDALLTTLLGNLYPVGSIYIGTQSTCPLATLISGSTWVKVSEGRVLQGTDSNHAAGSTIEAGLPNITGKYNNRCLQYGNDGDQEGALYHTDYGWRQAAGGTDWSGGMALAFDASRSNSIYGSSSTVQPPAYVVNIWKRTV